MDKYNELLKLQTALKIPVNDLIFNSTEVEIISGDKNIGAIPYHTVSDVISYDIPKQEVNWLNWNEVYNQHIQLINTKIIQLIGTDEVEVVCGHFRNLYIKNENGQLLCILECAYENNDWIVS